MKPREPHAKKIARKKTERKLRFISSPVYYIRGAFVTREAFMLWRNKGAVA